MKRIAAIVLFVLWAGSAYAAPFVESDPYPVGAVQPDGFLVSMDGGAVVESPAVLQSAGSYKLRFDIGNLPEGSHEMVVRAYKEYPSPWGRRESVPANFTFPVPARPNAVGGFRLAP